MIDDILIQRKYWVYSFSISLFSLCSATFPTFVGYNFENAFALCMFLWELFMFFLLLLFSVKFLQLDRRHSVFRKKRYPFLFSAFYVILSLTFALVACFTTRFVSYPDSSFSVFINPVFYLFVFLPLYFSYALFCYYAFMKCFGKYTKSGQGKDRQAVEWFSRPFLVFVFTCLDILLKHCILRLVCQFTHLIYIYYSAVDFYRRFHFFV